MKRLRNALAEARAKITRLNVQGVSERGHKRYLRHYRIIHACKSLGVDAYQCDRALRSGMPWPYAVRVAYEKSFAPLTK